MCRMHSLSQLGGDGDDDGDHIDQFLGWLCKAAEVFNPGD